MDEFENILNVTYCAYAVNGGYGRVNNSDDCSTQTLARNRSVAGVREMSGSEITVVHHNAREAGDAVSAIQIFTDAIETIAEKLMKILELAKKAVEPYYSNLQADKTQNQFRNLVKEINQIVNNTEYNYNKPFVADGNSLSISIGNNLKVDIETKDFRFNAQSVNIVKDPQNALSMVNEAITNVDEYKTHLERQVAYLKDITTAFELEMQGAMGVDMQDFQPELAVPMADYVANLILKDKQNSLNTQANLASSEALKLLKNSY